MITFDLSCGNGHRFEGWFQSRDSFEEQLSKKMVACPLCDSREITKRPSACAVHLSRGGEAQSGHNSGGDEKAQVLSYFRELTNFVQSNFEDVGNNFADEAVKMKSGESPSRSIRGTTTPEQEEKLTDEGVEFFKMALPKYDA